MRRERRRQKTRKPTGKTAHRRQGPSCPSHNFVPWRGSPQRPWRACLRSSLAGRKKTSRQRTGCSHRDGAGDYLSTSPASTVLCRDLAWLDFIASSRPNKNARVSVQSQRRFACSLDCCCLGRLEERVSAGGRGFLDLRSQIVAIKSLQNVPSASASEPCLPPAWPGLRRCGLRLRRGRAGRGVRPICSATAPHDPQPIHSTQLSCPQKPEAPHPQRCWQGQCQMCCTVEGGKDGRTFLISTGLKALAFFPCLSH